MGTFNTKTTLNGSPSLIPEIADRICHTFTLDGYEINREDLMSGGIDLSLTKGGFFKAVLGMKTALKITLVPMNDAIEFEAGVGIFGHQAIPTFIMLFVAWPVLLTQIWGLVQQSHLDDKALAVAQAVVNEKGPTISVSTREQIHSSLEDTKFCTHCGTQHQANARFCSNCGSPLS